MAGKQTPGRSRREFLKLVFAVSGSAVLFSRCSREAAGAWRFLTAEEATLLKAVADQIIPPDKWPGGAEAGVVGFIDQQLTEAYRHYQADYRKGSQIIQKNCYSLHGRPFEMLPYYQQTMFLKAMEAGDQPGGNWDEGFDVHFFSLLRDHCLQGFYGSPRHGGNRNYVSYKMLKLDYPLIIGRNTYQ